MLLTNVIHGDKIETDPSMKLDEVLEDPDGTAPGIPLSPAFPAFWSTESTQSTMTYNRIQQCNDVFEVLKRSRNKLSTMVGLPETTEKFWHGGSLDKNPRERMVTFMANITQTTPDPPSRAPTYGSRESATLGELNHFFSVRGSRGRTEAAITKTAYIAPKPIAPVQHAVQQSLIQSNVIPQTLESSGPSTSLSLFRTNTSSGIVTGAMDHFRKLTKEQEHKTVGDYYILIFLVEFLSFVIVTFGFLSIFGEDSFQLPW